MSVSRGDSRATQPTLAALFDPVPWQWGLRGDPHLWSEMVQEFAAAALPPTADDLAAMVRDAFERLSGRAMSEPEPFYVERFDHGGMSGGFVDPRWWRGTALPLLLERHAKAAAADPAQSPATPETPMARYGNGKICYVELPTTDIRRSADFYTAVFGWQIRTRGDGSTAFDDGVGEVSGTWVTGRPPSSEPGMLLYIMVDSVADTVDAVLAHGGELVQPIGADAPEITARFRDPGGNVIGLYQQPDHGP